MDIGISILLSLVIIIGTIGISFYLFPKSNFAFLAALGIAAVGTMMMFKFT